MYQFVRFTRGSGQIRDLPTHKFDEVVNQLDFHPIFFVNKEVISSGCHVQWIHRCHFVGISGRIRNRRDPFANDTWCKHEWDRIHDDNGTYTQYQCRTTIDWNTGAIQYECYTWVLDPNTFQSLEYNQKESPHSLKIDKRTIKIWGKSNTLSRESEINDFLQLFRGHKVDHICVLVIVMFADIWTDLG